jgi:KEOPS complex subunit Cgi121
MRVIVGETTIDDVDAVLDRLGELADDHGVVAQAFNARCVAGLPHLTLATRCALRARAHGDTIADDLAVEILCYAAGRRQIGEALALGLSEGEAPVAVVVVDPARDPASLQVPSTASESAPTEARPAEREVAAAIADELGLATDPDRAVEALRAATDAERLRRTFDIDDAESDATDAPLPALVRERTALLAVTK